MSRVTTWRARSGGQPNQEEVTTETIILCSAMLREVGIDLDSFDEDAVVVDTSVDIVLKD